MPQDSSLEVAGRIDDWWSSAKRDILADPFGQMARAGLFQIGLPGAEAALDTYRGIAIAEQAIVAKTALLGLASAFAARQMTARFFIAGFAHAGQRATWLPRIAVGQVCAAIAISEPEVGAHPKHLRTAAESSGAGFVVRGRKAWVTNGPIADLFLVLAVTAIEDERKRYGLFLIPRETAGLVVKPMQTRWTLSRRRRTANWNSTDATCPRRRWWDRWPMLIRLWPCRFAISRTPSVPPTFRGC